MDSDLENQWIVRGQFEVLVAQRLVRHRGCTFRIVSEPGSALWVDVEGAPPPMDDLPLMQMRAWSVFYLTERMLEQFRRMRKQREGR